MLKINDTITIEDWELSEQFTRASGPGGQNVNKVSTAVELRFEALRSPNLPAHSKNRLRQLSGRRWTKDGAILIHCDETRSQSRNRDLARARLAKLILASLDRPKRRVATRPTLASKRRRVEGKKKRGSVKSLRSKVTRDE